MSRSRHVAGQLGLDLRRLRRVGELGMYARNRREFRRALDATPVEDLAWGPEYPILGERAEPAGSAQGHYFHQDLLVARRIFEAAPERHIDVGSRVDGFVAHVASFRAIEVVDIRPLESGHRITFHQADATGPEPLGARLGTYDSVSSLHAVEHFGLGRYGDPLDVHGHVRGFESISTLVGPRGTLYFSVPISHRPRIEFDAHRILSVPYIMDRLVRDAFDVTEFGYVDDDGQLHQEQDVRSLQAKSSFGLEHGLGIFVLQRVAT